MIKFYINYLLIVIDNKLIIIDKKYQFLWY